jgi:hypothetical protein
MFPETMAQTPVAPVTQAAPLQPQPLLVKQEQAQIEPAQVAPLATSAPPMNSESF